MWVTIDEKVNILETRRLEKYKNVFLYSFLLAKYWNIMY